MLETDEIFPQVSPAWQVHLWKHPVLQRGCLVSVSSGNAKTISFSLASLLRDMTGAISCDGIMRHFPQLFVSPDKSREIMEEIVEHLSNEGIIDIYHTPKSTRSFPPPIPYYHRLRVLQLQLTNRCNLQCLHCYANSNAHSYVGLPEKNIKNLIDEFVSLGGIKLFLTGGEPLLRPELEDIVAYAKSRYLFVYLSTNGYAVTPTNAERLTRLGVGAVNFSLDGADAATHDAFRQCSGSFQRVLNAIDSFRAQNTACGVQTTVHKKNLKQGVKIFDMMRSKGVDKCFFVRMMPQGRAVLNSQLIPTMEEYRLELSEIYCHRHLHYNESVYPQNNISQELPIRCTAATSQMYIRADGSCFPCPALETDSLLLGHYPQTSLEEIWTKSTGPLADIRNFDPGSIEQCQGCEHQLQCKGGCAGNALRYHGNWTKADPHACVIMDVLKEIDRLPINH